MNTINENWLNKETGKYRCPHCNKEYTKKGIGTHIWRSHGEGKNFTGNNKGFKDGTRSAWNKGLTKDTDDRVKNYGETYSKRVKSGDIKIHNKGKSTSEMTKKRISESMKIAHNEGRAHNIGQSRWNNEMSYPEKFFREVIENEFKDKNFVQEYNVGIFSIDFAWVDKKLAIEIDGEQHEKPEYKERDKRKDKKLTSEGWKVLRIKWKDLYHNTKSKIKEAKDFIEE